MNSKTQFKMNRRNFIRSSAVATFVAALAASPLSSERAFAAPVVRSARQENMDLEILNYALTLEHLEAAAYNAINSAGILSGMAASYFNDFGAHENEHVTVLTQTISDLGGTPVQAQDSYNFPELTTEQEVLEYFQTVEELGAAAYLAQAPRLMSADLITAAVQIHNVEGQHAAILSDLIGVSPSPAFAEAKSMEEVLAVVTPILMAPDDGMDDGEMDDGEMDDGEMDDGEMDDGDDGMMPGMPDTGFGGMWRTGARLAR
jgi:hypothetical protein